jgi:hypothetical protein
MDVKENWMVWSVITLAASLITAYATLHAQNGSGGTGILRSDFPPVDPTAKYELILKSAVRNADQAEITALRALDPQPLYDYFGGEALQQELNGLEALESHGLHKLAELSNIEFTTIKVEPDASHARLDLIETWNDVYYDSTGTCIGKSTNISPQAVSLERKGDRWLIVAIDHKSHNPPNIQPCDS